MKVLRVAEGKRGRRALALVVALTAAIPVVQANLIFTEQVSVNEVRRPADSTASDAIQATPSLQLGDALTIRYEISQPADNSSSDSDGAIYDHVQASVSFDGQTLYSAQDAQLRVLNLIGFYGITVSDFSGPLLDFLTSTSPDVLLNGFLAPDKLISEFDSAAGGSVFVDGQVVGFQTTSYQFAGTLPIAPVPEPASYGMLAGLALVGLVSVKRLRSRR